jgi:parallel beta-helix repeat protein
MVFLVFGPFLAPASAQRLASDPLGGRTAASAETLITVTTSSDVVDGNTASLALLASQPGADSAVSLREAILATNSTSAAGPLAIAFNLPTSDPGYNSSKSTWTIRIGAEPPPDPASGRALPALTRGGVTIDGSTQPGNPSHPQIVLDGYEVVEAGGLSNGITINSSDNTIRGLTLVNFYDDAVLISGPNAALNRIVGCYLGPDANGAAAREPSYFGVELRDGAHDNTIGGADIASRNLISGNAHSGVIILGAATRNNTIAGNWIGVNSSGQAALKNTIAGIMVQAAAHDNLIGGANQGNLISGNETGIYIDGGVATTIAGNTIGLAADGHTPLANVAGGIWMLRGARDNIVGGAGAARNIISGNGAASSQFGQGIYLASGPAEPLTTNNSIQGNYIGTDASGNQPAGNYRQGVLIGQGAQNNVVGGSAPGAGNVIAYNGLGGVRIDSAGNLVAGNLIGVGADGVTQLGNQLNGVRVGGDNNTIGPGNTIAYNQQSGILLSGGATTVLSNTLISNARSGVCVAGPNSTLRGNLVESNGGSSGPWPDCAIRAGIVITGTNGTLVSENHIHANSDVGVVVYGGVGNRILLNSISDNLTAGIQLVSGGNNDVAPPQLGSVTTTTVNGTACALCRVEVFTDTGDQGKDFLGVTTAGSNGFFSQVLVSEALPGRHVTATHTDSNGNTSPFATAVSVPTPSPAEPTPTVPRPPLLSPRLYIPVITL